MDNTHLLNQSDFMAEDISALLGMTDAEDIAALRQKAFDTATQTIGDRVYLRGLLELSNICSLDCHYCGIRKSNRDVPRYCLTLEDVRIAARQCAEAGFGSMVIQSGERQDDRFVAFVTRCIETIKGETRSDQLPDGLGITLSVGTHDKAVYRRFFEAGAHRYLLRIETTNRKLFARIHPKTQSYEARLDALHALKECGFQTGTGIMIGLPGQSLSDLAADILFFKAFDIDMIGMGPYIVAEDTPMAHQGMMDTASLLQLSLNMIAVTRLVLKDVNIASTTALQALVSNGREQGFSYGANVAMPNLTPTRNRDAYQLYEGKPGIHDTPEHAGDAFEAAVTQVGRRIGWHTWGDSRHFRSRKQ